MEHSPAATFVHVGHKTTVDGPETALRASPEVVLSKLDRNGRHVHGPDLPVYTGHEAMEGQTKVLREGDHAH